MVRKILYFIAGLALLLTLTAAQEAKSYHATRFDVTVQVENGGSLLVTETVVFEFIGGPFTFVFREIPLDHTDGITDIVASIDGRPIPAGTAPGQLEVSNQNPLHLTWHFEPISNSSHTFGLTYRVLGVVRQSETADLLQWQALPDDYDYAIDHSTVHFTYPAGAELIAPPQLLAGSGQLGQEDGAVIVTTEQLAANAPLVIALSFRPGQLISQPPRWQFEEQQWANLGPLWLAGAIILFITGLVVLFSYERTIHPPSSTIPAGSVTTPPDSLPAALAGLLNNSGGKPTWNNALATLFELAGRGILFISEASDQKWYQGRDYLIKQVNDPAGLQPHQQGLLDMLFETKSGRVRQIKMSELSTRMTGKQWQKFTNPLEADLENSGLIHPGRKQARLKMIVMGVMICLFGLASFFLAITLAPSFGQWPLSIGISLILLGFITLGVGSNLPILSDQGQKIAKQWREFANHLKQISKDKQPIPPDLFESYLPIIASYNLLNPWLKHFKKEGEITLPTWFQTTANDGFAHFTYFASSVASAGGDATGGAGAAGAGSAGGGSSGAG